MPWVDMMNRSIWDLKPDYPDHLAVDLGLPAVWIQGCGAGQPEAVGPYVQVRRVPADPVPGLETRTETPIIPKPSFS